MSAAWIAGVIWITAGLSFALGWACGAIYWKGRAQELLNRVVDNDGELDPRQLDSSLDFPRPLGAPPVTLPAPYLFACQCPNCSFRRSVAADALILASGCVPPRTAGVEP